MTPGTRVRIVGEYYPDAELSVGATGVVVTDNEDYVDVVMDTNFTRSGDNRWPFYVTELEVIE